MLITYGYKYSKEKRILLTVTFTHTTYVLMMASVVLIANASGIVQQSMAC